MSKTEEEQKRAERHRTYEHDKLPATITRTLFVRYGVGEYTQGRISLDEYESSGSSGFEAVTLCETEITVSIPKKQNIKGKVLKVLEEEKAKVMAENHQRLKAVQDKIDNLLAIEHKS